MTEAEIRERLADACAEVPLTRQQLGLLHELVDVYERAGLLNDGSSPPLWRCCPRASECWTAELLAYRPDERAEDGGVFLPWVGPRYAPGGVAVLGINLRDASGFDIEYVISVMGPGSQFGWLSHGGYKPHGSWWAYRSLRTAGLVLDAVRGVLALDREDPRDVAPVLLETARLQAVKCSPRDHLRSDRSRQMNENCPAMLLSSELEVLAPSAIVTFGSEARAAVSGLAGFAERSHRPGASASVRGKNFRAVVYSLRHPSARHALWEQDHADLHARLEAA